jgi:oligoribonuclease NrnB/cAMP/cGMP phosphodiesterase (DHH superfamily)
MIKFDPNSISTIVTHDNCADGTSSALLLKDALPNANVVFVQYGTEAYINLPAQEGMLFCDISPPADRAEEFIKSGAYVLDHHRTAKHLVESFGDRGIFADENDDVGISGAVLAFREVWLPIKGNSASQEVKAWVEKFARLAGVRDTWHKKSPEWEDACVQSNLLHFMPNTNWVRYGITGLMESWDEYWAIGRILLEKHMKSVQKALRGGYFFTTDKGTRAVVFNSKSFTSDAAEYLNDKADVVIGFGYEVEAGVGKLILSTRSYGSFDCSALTRRMGGGGHSKAAGASLIVPAGENPYETVTRLLNTYEASS